MNTYPDIITIGGPTYGGVLLPFTFNNGTIDLPSSWSSGRTLAPANEGVLIRRLGGDSLIQYIGPNFKNYIYNVASFGGYKVSNTSSITVALRGIAVRVQQLGTQNLPTVGSNSSFAVSTAAPVTGFLQYGSTFVFDDPLVISATASLIAPPYTSRKIYITFFTQWYH